MGRYVLILLDTHVVLWLAFEEERISKAAQTAINEARNGGAGLAICGITLLELATAFAKRRFSLNISLEAFFNKVEEQFTIIPIEKIACLKTLELPKSYPNDPADRIIGATAIAQGFSLVTADAEIRRSRAVRTIR